MPRNIELKARLSSLAPARVVAQRLATRRLGEMRQRDTYFCVPTGRLKLREIEGQPAELIAYHRPDSSEPRGSNYILAPAPDPETLKQALAAVLGIRAVVEKIREVFLYEQVRIHLDEVIGLGCFLEFESVLEPGIDDAAGHAQLTWLIDQFGVQPAEIVPHSYVDLQKLAGSFDQCILGLNQ